MVSDPEPHVAVGYLDHSIDEVHRRRADELGDEPVDRPAVDFLGRIELLDDPVLHHGDPIGKRHRLHLIMRDVYDRGPELLMQLLDLDAQLVTQLGIKIGQGLVEEKDGHAAHERPPDRHPLPLAPRQLRWPATE